MFQRLFLASKTTSNLNSRRSLGLPSEVLVVFGVQLKIQSCRDLRSGMMSTQKLGTQNALGNWNHFHQFGADMYRACFLSGNLQVLQNFMPQPDDFMSKHHPNHPENKITWPQALVAWTRVPGSKSTWLVSAMRYFFILFDCAAVRQVNVSLRVRVACTGSNKNNMIDVFVFFHAQNQNYKMTQCSKNQRHATQENQAGLMNGHIIAISHMC